MDEKTLKILLTIASGVLAAGGMFLLGISILSETKDTWTLSIALMAVVLSNLFNMVRLQYSRRRDYKSKKEDI